MILIQVMKKKIKWIIIQVVAEIQELKHLVLIMIDHNIKIKNQKLLKRVISPFVMEIYMFAIKMILFNIKDLEKKFKIGKVLPELEVGKKEIWKIYKWKFNIQKRNATLQTENRSLKNQIQFLRGIVKPSTKQSDLASSDNIDKYLNLSPKKKDSEIKPQQHYQSPFDEDDSALNWIRSSASSGSRSNWSTLFVLTIVVCVFVLPSDSPDGTIVAQQTGSTVVSQTSSLIQLFLHYGKYCAKYVILLAYLLFAGCFVYGKFNNKKMKKILKMV